MRSPIPSLIILLSIPQALAFPAQVIGISDGDTLTVLVDKKPMKVRIAEIDAPESKQPYGTWSKQALSDLCYCGEAKVAEVSRNRSRRTITGVNCRGHNARPARHLHYDRNRHIGQRFAQHSHKSASD